MWLDQVSNLGPLALELDMLPTAVHGPAHPYNCSMFRLPHLHKQIVFEVQSNDSDSGSKLVAECMYII